MAYYQPQGVNMNVNAPGMNMNVPGMNMNVPPMQG